MNNFSSSPMSRVHLSKASCWRASDLVTAAEPLVLFQKRLFVQNVFITVAKMLPPLSQFAYAYTKIERSPNTKFFTRNFKSGDGNYGKIQNEGLRGTEKSVRLNSYKRFVVPNGQCETAGWEPLRAQQLFLAPIRPANPTAQDSPQISSAKVF